MKLLTDEELKQEIFNILDFFTEPTGEEVYLKDLERDVYNLIESQKKAYAEYVIGENDTTTMVETYMGEPVSADFTRNILRAEQRERNNQ